MRGNDFTWLWPAARELLAGHNPYDDCALAGWRFAFDGPFPYPLPVALLALPLNGLPVVPAGAVLFGTGSARLPTDARAKAGPAC